MRRSRIRPTLKRNKFIKKYLLKSSLLCLVVVSSFLFGVLADKILILKSEATALNAVEENNKDLVSIQKKVIKKNYVFKIKWDDLGKRMVEDGVIDKIKLAQAITGTSTLPKDLDKYFEEGQNKIEVNQRNAQFWVDVLWGLGLANKNKILEEGEMMQDGDASNFASTGGWTLGVDNPMSHYSGHSYITLSDKQQDKVKEIAGNIYRPCCGNSTAFPDCNHGMAALGLIELMTSQGFSKDEIYKTVLAFNTYWFPDTYLDIAYYLAQNDRDYEKTSPKEILSKTFSSAMGAEAIHKKVGAIQQSGEGSGGSCGA